MAQMGEKYFPSKYTGVRYREHASRRNGIRKDRYFMIRYKFDGKTKNEGFGWESQGYTELKAFEAVCAIKQNIKNGTGYKSLKEKYELANQERKAKEAEEAAEKERNITFSELWDNIYEPIYLSKKIQKTQVNEKSLYKKYIFPKIGALKIYEITPADIERLKDYLFSPALRANGEEKCLAPATVNHILDVIRQVFNSGINAGKFLNTNPASKVKRIKKDNRRIRFLSKEEIQELLDTLALMTNSPLHDICLLSLDTGLRANEIFSLEWMDVNFETKTLSIRDPKGIINRYANMTNKVYEMLVQRKNTVAVSSYVFTNTKGEKIKEISNQFDRVVAKLGFNDNITDTRNKVVFHTLRHTFASRLAMGGVDVYTIKELMGHSDIKMTMRYMHLAPKKFQEAISVIEAD